MAFNPSRICAAASYNFVEMGNHFLRAAGEIVPQGQAINMSLKSEIQFGHS